MNRSPTFHVNCSNRLKSNQTVGEPQVKMDYIVFREDNRGDPIWISFVYMFVRANSNSTNTTWALMIPK